MPDYEVVVLGLGGVGSAALCELASRGVRAVGLDRFPPPHSYGSSHGHTRIIRKAYFEHPDYVPLLEQAYQRWLALEQRVGQRLFHEIGLLQIGPEAGGVVSGVLRAAAEHQLPLEQFSGGQLRKRWPQLVVPPSLVGVLEAQAGCLLVEECVRSQLAAAEAAGAEMRVPCEVLGWDVGPPLRIQTTEGTLTSQRLIVTAGPWANSLLGDLDVPWEIRRKSVFWYTPEQPFSPAHDIPCFLVELPHGVFYGFPQLDFRGIKLAEHSGGEPIRDPLAVDRSLNPTDQARIDAFRAEHLPGVTGNLLEHQTCLYTMSPDEHFVVDRLPQATNVVFAAGLSGHGFKFAPVLGAALADLALDGGSKLPIEFLSMQRLAK